MGTRSRTSAPRLFRGSPAETRLAWSWRETFLFSAQARVVVFWRPDFAACCRGAARRTPGRSSSCADGVAATDLFCLFKKRFRYLFFVFEMPADLFHQLHTRTFLLFMQRF